MRNIVILVCLLMVLTASVAGAWTSKMEVFGNPATWIDVVTTATFTGPNWTWTYALTPGPGANNIRGLTITLGPTETAMIIGGSITSVKTAGIGLPPIGPIPWTGFASGSAVYWQTTPNGPDTLDNIQAETFVFGFDHPWGPKEDHVASAQDTFGYSGSVKGPAPPPIPEPMSVLLGVMGLSSLAGFRKLRGK